MKTGQFPPSYPHALSTISDSTPPECESDVNPQRIEEQWFSVFRTPYLLSVSRSRLIALTKPTPLVMVYECKHPSTRVTDPFEALSGRTHFTSETADASSCFHRRLWKGAIAEPTSECIDRLSGSFLLTPFLLFFDMVESLKTPHLIHSHCISLGYLDPGQTHLPPRIRTLVLR